MGANPEELYPVLVAELADEESCALVRAAASRRGVLVVPLLSAPVDRRRHLLEVSIPGGTAETFLAEPAGAPTEEGFFPLRIEPIGGAPAKPEASHDAEPSFVQTAARSKRPTLSRQHTNDLAASSADAEPMLANIGRLLARGKYRVDSLVGSGSAGAVYRGYHRDLGRDVAVKILHPAFHSDPEFSKRFTAEAKTMSRISHPNVTRVLDFGEEDDGLLYLAMEFLDGIDLQSLLKRDGLLELERLAKLMIQVTAALGHVHRHQIIHRDVKPRNIVVVAGLDEENDTPTEVAKVCDFGIALASGEVEGAGGTPAYMSPEQLQGGRVDARSDVYATGVLMCKLATGRLPFASGTVEIRRANLDKPLTPPSQLLPSIDPLLEAIIMKAISPDPAARQQSMRDLRVELRELLAPAIMPIEPASVRNLPTAVSSDLQAPPSMRTPHTPSDDGPRARQASEPDVDDWLDKGGSAYTAFLSRGTLAEREIDGAWLAELAALHELYGFTEAVKALDVRVRQALQAGEVAMLAAVITTMRVIINQNPTAPRANYAGSILRLLREPSVLVPFVDAVLGAPAEPSVQLQQILIETQGAGATALCAGRHRHVVATSRERFVKMMRAFGPVAVPSIAATLRECLAKGERGGDLIDDLLAAIPPGADENAGAAVAELLRCGPTPATTSAALGTLAMLWGERARPLLIGALGHQHPAVVIASLAGLRHMQGVDGRVVQRLEGFVFGIIPAPEELRVAAVTALASVLPEARHEAWALLVSTFKAEHGSRSAASPAVTVALARALLALGVPQAAGMIAQRAAQSPDPLRTMLASLAKGG